jgi:hypothetical protein
MELVFALDFQYFLAICQTPFFCKMDLPCCSAAKLESIFACVGS